MGLGEEDLFIPENFPYPHIEIKIGDLLTSNAQTLVNTVNCVGIMGKGLALQFKNRYPQMFDRYKDLCDMGKITVGSLFLYSIPGSYKKILNFPTKDHWRNGSKIEYIVSGLRKFVDRYHEFEITSVAFPMLGCRNGGLKKSAVYPIMIEFLKGVDIPVEIWFLDNTPAPVCNPLF